ncbi:MAG: nuclear transport factor 2 family protein [Spirochaetales bacterium]|nr:nuclear transport factor 2 family protein [Spirochaetales bacterium]
MAKTGVRVVLGLLAGALMVVSGCAGMGKAGEESDVAAIQEIWRSYSAAATSGDAALWLSLWDDSGIQMPPDVPARPKKVLDEVVPKAWAMMKIHTMNIKAEETTIMGDFAFSRGTYTSERTVNNKTVTIDGKFLTLFRRQADGSWRLYRDCFNSNVAPK